VFFKRGFSQSLARKDKIKTGASDEARAGQREKISRQ
jgi:hypothetical protein